MCMCMYLCTRMCVNSGVSGCRLCGLLSIVPVWTMKGRPRVEVRTSAQAISLTADRYSDIILLPSQSSVLADRSPHACITGPVGSGKTLLLQLKGRQWLQEGHRVVVLNTRTTARGRAIGHVLEESIKRGEDSWSSGGSVEKHDLAMCDFHIDKFREQLEERGPTGRVCFLLDELSTHRLKDLIMPLIDALPACPIWFSSLAVTDCPAGFQLFRLDTSLRCPPSVQRLLKVMNRQCVSQSVSQCLSGYLSAGQLISLSVSQSVSQSVSGYLSAGQLVSLSVSQCLCSYLSVGQLISLSVSQSVSV